MSDGISKDNQIGDECSTWIVFLCRTIISSARWRNERIHNPTCFSLSLSPPKVLRVADLALASGSRYTYISDAQKSYYANLRFAVSLLSPQISWQWHSFPPPCPSYSNVFLMRWAGSRLQRWIPRVRIFSHWTDRFWLDTVMSSPQSTFITWTRLMAAVPSKVQRTHKRARVASDSIGHGGGNCCYL